MKKVSEKFLSLFMVFAMLLTSFSAFIPMTVHAATEYWLGFYNSQSPFGKIRISRNSWNSGWMAAYGNNYDEGSQFTVEAQPDSGYVFKEWRNESDAFVSNQQSYNITLTEETKLYAIFESASGLPNRSK